MFRQKPIFLVIALAAMTSSALASTTQPKIIVPAVYVTLAECRSEADAAARLACFDQASEKLELAIRAKEVTIVDKAQVEKAKRGLFGLRLPSLGIFGGGDAAGDNEGNQLQQIESTVTSAGGGPAGWTISLADGSIWQQTDGNTLALSPKPGMPVLVKRGALGSYMMNVRKQPAIRVKRVQ